MTIKGQDEWITNSSADLFKLAEEKEENQNDDEKKPMALRAILCVLVFLTFVPVVIRFYTISIGHGIFAWHSISGLELVKIKSDILKVRIDKHLTQLMDRSKIPKAQVDKLLTQLQVDSFGSLSMQDGESTLKWNFKNSSTATKSDTMRLVVEEDKSITAIHTQVLWRIEKDDIPPEIASYLREGLGKKHE